MIKLLELNDCVIGREKPLINAFSTSVSSKGLIVLSGSNGSGKSTLLKSICGFIPLLGGSVKLNGRSLLELTRSEIARFIAFAGTERVREDYITLEEMISFGRYPYDETRQSAETKIRIDKICSDMGLGDIRSKYLDKVSDGEWQKANIARVLAQDTPIIIMDEPSAFLDYPSRIRLFRDLKSYCSSQNKTVILSTHDIETANNFADFFWHISENCFFESNTPPVWSI